MKLQKRRRETEADSPPATKQAKIGDYFLSSHDALSPVSTFNRFAPLVETADDLIDLSPQSPPVRTGSEGDEAPPLTTSGDSMITLNEASDNLLLITARTVEFIFKELRLLHSKLDKLLNGACDFNNTQAASGRDKNPAVANCDKQPATCSRREGLAKLPPQQQERERTAPSQLVWQPHKICLQVCKFKGSVPSWRTASLVKKHLVELFGKRTGHVDIKTVEPLNDITQAQRVLLSFHSPSIPKLLFHQKALLNSKGIFPIRVFKDMFLTPLLPMISCSERVQDNVTSPAVLNNTPEMADSSTLNAPQLPRAGNDSIPSSCLLDNKLLEEEVLESFKALPLAEQKLITDRLEVVRTNFLKNMMDKPSPSISPMIGIEASSMRTEIQTQAVVHQLEPLGPISSFATKPNS